MEVPLRNSEQFCSGELILLFILHFLENLWEKQQYTLSVIPQVESEKDKICTELLILLLPFVGQDIKVISDILRKDCKLSYLAHNHTQSEERRKNTKDEKMYNDNSYIQISSSQSPNPTRFSFQNLLGQWIF